MEIQKEFVQLAGVVPLEFETKKTVVAKFKCESLLTNEYNKTASLRAVTTGSEENKSFFNIYS